MFENNETLKNIIDTKQGTGAPSLDQLKDIKPLVEIPDSSIYLFWGLIGLGILVIALILFFAIRQFLQIRRSNLAKKYLASLKAIHWEDAKQSAYDATYYGRLLAVDARRVELFEQLQPKLEQYKYKKEVASVDDDTLRRFNLYVQVCNESV